jgi:hypothetical protein
MFPSIFAIRYTKFKVKIRALDQVVPEVMPLYHPKVFDWLWSYTEGHRGSHSFKVEKLRSEIIFCATSHVLKVL